ncbi:alpha-amylase family protein [Algoriphagus sp.]|jgi:glycosidase|uniref:alpha-amylase family protein n=1 Tax=Algoriphagus sp. TaxID=1872435 RepID=UPI002715CD79|nr:alpha-amylase family protein [Algoriphagus sp.]MDO8966532.1 alpha-amylase family protein [Algoriphagus sp.]MDP3201978.1 alpha-amylase family protein [Algoriphagus sp.]
MKKFITAAVLLATVFSCQKQSPEPSENSAMKPQKIVLYQVFTRLFGNTNTTNKPWGTKEENGVGKFNDFTDIALGEIKKLGVSHIWYTGVPHHGVIGSFPEIGVNSDDPDVIKGRAGSPYAVRDYYQVNPDLAVDVTKRMEEFEALIARTHKHGMKVIIDIVPNHVSRHYEGKNNPEGVNDFGAKDDKTIVYARDNNFYYIPGQSFKVPEAKNNYKPLGGEKHQFADGKFEENPAKWTGNGSRKAQPDFYDWYETVKINYGVSPDGQKDFDELPAGADSLDWKAHYNFWKGRDVPDSWIKFKDITQFWLGKGVDGFRFDMAEMVPVEFWSYLNSHIKNTNSDAFLLAEVYNPTLYRDYILKGKMDYLYDKVELYDTLKHIIQGTGSTDNLVPIQAGKADIEKHMLHFLENHDEQRIASPEFAGNPWKAMPAMVVSATVSTAPIMIYFGQEVGEPGAEGAGFGEPSRTSIFDYIGVPQHQKWMNGGKFDGGQLSDNEKALRNYYSEVLNFTRNSPALMGEYLELHTFNRHENPIYGNKAFAFARWDEGQKLIVVTNFDELQGIKTTLKLPAELLKAWNLKTGEREIKEVMFWKKKTMLRVTDSGGEIDLDFGPLESAVFEVR